MENVIAGEQIARDEHSAGHSAALIAADSHGAEPRHVESGHQRKDVAREEVPRLIPFGMGQELLGLSFQSIRCHYLKSDPISHEDYYRLEALLGATDLEDLPTAGEVGIREHE